MLDWICAGVYFLKTTCPISHTGVRTRWCLRFFKDAGLLVPSWWTCIYQKNSRSKRCGKWGVKQLFRIHTKNVLMSVQANLISIFDTAIELLPAEKLLFFSHVVTVKKEKTQHMVPQWCHCCLLALSKVGHTLQRTMRVNGPTLSVR